MIGIIGGTGFERLISEGIKTELDTPYGNVEYIKGYLEDVDIIFIPRHGFRHEKPPHKIPYKANIYTFHKLGIERVIGISAVGSLREDLPPGSIVIPNQLIDYTTRRDTFYDEKAVHVDVTRPYCREMMKIVINKAHELKIDLRYGYVYITTEGPRFETPAEIRMFKKIGADIVGMTNIPEAILAREIGLHYILIALVTNYAAGMQNMVSMDEVYDVTKKAERNLYKLIRYSIKELSKAYLDDECTKFKKFFGR